MTQKRFFLLLPSVVIGVLAVVGMVSAATTISTDIQTAGNIYATSSMEIDGSIVGLGTLTITNSVKAANLYASSTVEIDGAVTSPSIDAVSGTFTLGGTNASAITVGKSSITTTIAGAATVSGQTTLSATTTITTAATTTLKALSSSATKGFCLQFNATSTNTALNMTFMASTTAPTNGSGVIPTVAYGACN